MNEGWLWLSILNTTASPSPISTTPAFSPGPQITRGPVVGRVLSQIFDDLYEQCSLHIAAKIPSSVRFGVRPRIATARSNSSSVSPCSAARAGVTLLLPVTAHQNEERGRWSANLPSPPACGGRGRGPVAFATGRVRWALRDKRLSLGAPPTSPRPCPPSRRRGRN